MKEIIRIYSKNYRHKNGQKGQVLLLVLVLMLVGITFITSTMGFMSTSFKTNKVYIDNTVQLYSAEAGIQDGIWNILNLSKDDLATNLLTATQSLSAPAVAYSEYDFNADGWLYHLADPNSGSTIFNTYPVDVTLKNAWVPMIDDSDSTHSWVPTLASPLPADGVIAAPNKTTANNIINNTNLLISGGVSTVPTYKITVSYKGTNNSTTSLPIISIGCWLPQGFTYNNSSSSLEGLYTTEQVLDCAGNEAVVWTFTNKTLYNLQTTAEHSGGTLAISFNYTTGLAKVPEALPWIVNTPTSGTNSFPYWYTWDADIDVYNLSSAAGDTAIEATVPKSQTRSLGGAMSGDYVATGNSLLTMASYNSNDVRTNLLSHSSATVSNVPTDANLQGAYLYWTGWLYVSSWSNSYYPQVNFKVNGTQVYFDAGGQPQTGSTALATTLGQNKWNGPSGAGYSYSCYRDVTSLIRKVLQAASPSATNLPGNAVYDVGPAAGYHMADTGGTYQEWAYAGWSLVLVYSGPTTLGHQLYLYDTFSYADNVKDIDITGNTAGPGGTISGFLVPAQVTGDVDAAKITACVGDGDFCYDSDFIAINAPSTYWSNPWNIPANSVYRLWDGVTLPSPYTSMNTATNKNNVWNSYSQTGLSEGIDIKTFHITWASGLVNPGDTSARIDVPTSTDSWSFIYMILSFRSSVTSGGSISYLIKRKDAP